MRNDIYLHYYCPKDWRIEEPIEFQYKDGLTYAPVTIIPDATFTLQGSYYFVEVDRTQSMAENKKKIELYAKLSPVIEKQFQHKPTIVFYTVSTLRKEKLKKICEENGLTCLVYAKGELP